MTTKQAVSTLRKAQDAVKHLAHEVDYTTDNISGKMKDSSLTAYRYGEAHAHLRALNDALFEVIMDGQLFKLPGWESDK